MDADDIAQPIRFEKQLAYLTQNPTVSVLGTGFRTFGDGITGRSFILPVDDETIRRRLKYSFFSICHPSVIYKRDVVLRNRGYQHVRMCEDFDLWLRLLRDEAVRFANLPEILLNYRVHADQARNDRTGYYMVA